MLSAIAMLVALKTEIIKTENRIQTYKEILEFVGGTRLDELERQIQIEKRKPHISKNVSVKRRRLKMGVDV